MGGFINSIPLKTEEDVVVLRRCGDLVSRTLAEVAPHVQPGVTTQALDKIAEDFIKSHNAEPAFKGYQVGNAIFPSTLCVSVNDQVVHGIPGETILAEGDIVSIDCGVILDGFYGDSAYTFAVGEIDEEIRDLCRVTYEALFLAVDKCRRGNRIGDVSAAVQDRCVEAGYGVVRDLVGHGIGRELHEPPQIPNVGRKGIGRKLKTGMTLCIEPMINLGAADVETDPDQWTIWTSDGSPSAHYEHMVSIGTSGPEVLTTFDYIETVIEAPYKQTA